MDLFVFLIATVFILPGTANNNCNELQQAANGGLPSGAYSVTNSNGDLFTVYCQFYSGYGYTFVSSNTNVDVDMTSLYDDTTHVVIRHKRENGTQYTAKMEQLNSYSSIPLLVEFNDHTGYQGHVNIDMSPYIYVGFIPRSESDTGDINGWKCNDVEYTFTNCDGNANSYITFLFNHDGAAYTSSGGDLSQLMFPWYNLASAVTSSENLPDEFFTQYYEIHHGGCGGFATGDTLPNNINVHVNVGVKFVITCATPNDISHGSKTYTNTIIGSTVTYSCNQGYRLESGDLTLTCNSTGGWAGTEPVCEEITCPTPGDVLHATYAYSGISIGNTLTYTCDARYTSVSGDSTRTCSNTGVWSGTEPVCEAVECATPNNIAHGSKSHTGTSIGSTVTYSCDEGYVMATGDTTLTCTETYTCTENADSTVSCTSIGEWTGMEPVCSDILQVDDGFKNHPGPMNLHENYDGETDLWTISAYCYVRYTYKYQCDKITSYKCELWGFLGTILCYKSRSETCYSQSYKTVTCNVCEIISANPSNNFQMNGLTVQKKTCNDHRCAACTSTGCLNGGEQHDVDITCYSTCCDTSGHIYTTLQVFVTYAAHPTFYYEYGTSINVYQGTVVGAQLNQLKGSVIDDDKDYDFVSYKQKSGPSNSYIHQTEDLFYLETSTGEVKLGKDLSTEFSYYFTMNLCVYDRRLTEACTRLSITLHACYQTPNCTNQTEQHLHDTFGSYTGHDIGSDNTIFIMEYPFPSKHFTDFSMTWHNLTWQFVSNEFPEADINFDTGTIFTTRNISIWPAWPTKTYAQEVRVSNTGYSCYSTTCSFIIIVHYTNWPIDIRSLPGHGYLHEDTDVNATVHSLIVFDYNNPNEDNVTCSMSISTPYEENLFYLQHDGNHAYNSYSIHKFKCEDPDCGYKYQNPIPYYCDTDRGCLTHNRTQQYVMTVTCWDAYNTTDAAEFTFNVLKNKAPTFWYLPTRIDLDRNIVSAGDKVFQIMYGDDENEDMRYEYRLDSNYFLASATGNYYDNLANITMAKYLWDTEANSTFTINICAHERRNEVCLDLIVGVQEYCSDTPTCNSASHSTDTSFAVGGELFDISTLVNDAGAFNGLSYSMKTSHESMFSIDSTTGKVILTEAFPEIFDSATYSIVGYAYNTGSCSHSTCQLTTTVTAVNYAVQIRNLPATVPMHGDTTTGQTVYIITASDRNVGDTYTCEIVNIASVEPFYLDRIPPESGSYIIKNRDNTVLSSTTTSYAIFITCTDTHGGSDTQVLTITVTLNQAPVLTSFGPGTTHVSADPMTYVSSSTIYTVAATDADDDELTFTCSVANNMVPFQCQAASLYVNIKLTRDIDIDHENGKVYTIQVCVRDAKHSDTCGSLQVTFTRVHTRPKITNLPLTLNIDEDIAIGTTLFNATIEDPDIGESHLITMSLTPFSQASTFQFDATQGILTLGEPLNYEEVVKYQFNFTITDDAGLSSLTAYNDWIILNVVNVNEGNTIRTEYNVITFYENTTAGTMLTDPRLTCMDTDNQDTTSFAIASGTYQDYFSMNSNTGRITLIKEWDLENNLPPTTVLLVSCSDVGGLSSSVAITINIEDVNDNAPTYTVTVGSVHQYIAITKTTSLSTDLLEIIATDADINDDADFDFTLFGPINSIGATYFRMVVLYSRKTSTGKSKAALRLKKSPDFLNDKIFPVTIKISDGDATNPKFTGITLAMHFTVGDPDEHKAKEAARCITCTRNGTTILATLALELVILLLFGMHACHSMCCSKNNVKKLSDFDKSVNVRFRPHPLSNSGQISSIATIGKSTNTTASKPSKEKAKRTFAKSTKTTAVIELRDMTNKRFESSSDSSSSSSKDSDDDNDDDDKVNPLPNRLFRQDIGRSKFQPVPNSQSPGLFHHVYSSSVSTGNLVSPSGVAPGFISDNW